MSETPGGQTSADQGMKSQQDVREEIDERETVEQTSGLAAKPSTREPEKQFAIDSEYLSGKRFPYQEDMSAIDGIDLEAATPGQDINWLEDIELLEEEGMPAVFDRYSNSFLKIYFDIPAGRENEIARKVLMAHLQSGNSYGIRLKEQHTKFPQPELGPWVEGSKTVGTDWKPAVLEGWEPPLH
jgi:hypothetical protein